MPPAISNIVTTLCIAAPGSGGIRRTILGIMFFLAATLRLAAQDIVVIGQVLSAVDAEPLQAAHVWFTGSNIGAVTNNEGFFMLRSNKPQKSVTVSVVGYKSRTVSLDYGRDQMLHILLKEDVSVLDEIVAIPNQNEAIALLARVYENRHRNDPANILDIETDRTSTTYLNLTDIKEKALRRRLFRQLQSGAVAQNDTNYSLPVYLSQAQTRITIGEDSTAETALADRTNAVSLLTEEQWKQFIAAYTPAINPYRPYSTILGHNFMSPVARTAKLYYNLYLADSTVTATGSKQYKVRFKPKNSYNPLFTGEFMIDSTTAAIVSADMSVTDHVSVNFLNQYNYRYSASPLADTHYPAAVDQFIGLQLNPLPTKYSPFFGAAIMQKDLYSDTRMLGDSIATRPVIALPDSIDDTGIDGLWGKIDSVNQTRIQRFAAWAVDVVMNQYLHIWQIDLGPIPNLFHYNRYEGASPLLQLRSNARFAKNFTFGGYYGYGFLDREHKYGGNVRWRFGRGHRNCLSFYYDHRVERYGYDDLHIYNENRIHNLDHLFSSLEQRNTYPVMGLRRRMMLDYIYERPGFRFQTDFRTERMNTNPYMPYLQNGHQVRQIDLFGLRFDFRLSWKENTLDSYFYRRRLGSRYPIVHFTAEAGLAFVGNYSTLYGKFGIYAKQQIPVGFGRFFWYFQANAVVGSVPFPLLVMSHSSRGSYFNPESFSLLGQMELLSDLYCQLNLRFQTRGYIFGYIPYVRKLGIRENLIFNIGYGHLREGHSMMLQIPSNVRPWNNMPYIEAGFGFGNILHVADIEFIWRVTHRNVTSFNPSFPTPPNFAVRWRFSLGL